MAETEARGESAPEFLRLLRILARVRQSEGKTANARVMLDRVLAISKKQNGPESRAMVEALYTVAIFLHDERLWTECEATFRRILAIEMKIFGANHPDFLRAKFSVAECMMEQTRTNDALVLMNDVLSVAANVLPASDQAFIHYCTKLTRAYQELGQHIEAKPHARRAYELALSIRGEKHPDTATAAASLACSLFALNESEEAQKLLGIALSTYEQEPPSEHSDIFAPLMRTGETLVVRNKPVEASALLRRVLLQRSRTFSEGVKIPAEVLRCREIYTRALRGQGISEKEIEARIRETAPQFK